MQLKMIISVFLIFLALGCIEQNTEETKLEVYQGLGILNFGMPTSTGTSSIDVEKVTPDSSAFLAMVVRNNAQGGKATDIKVSLDGVEPFKITECGEVYNATDYRTESNCYTGVYTDIPDECQLMCYPNDEIPEYIKNDPQDPSWDPTASYLSQPKKAQRADESCFIDTTKCLQYRTHSMSIINPDEEMIFFWTLKAPSSEKIANMYYEQEMLGILGYHYHTSVYVGVSSMNFNEYNSRQSQGLSLSGITTSSAGPIRISSVTDEPVLYSGGTQGFILKLNVENQGNGIPQPNKNMTLTVEYDNSILNFKGQGGLMSEASSNDKKWFEEEYGEQTQAYNLLTMKLEPMLLSHTYSISIPFDLIKTNINYQIIPFYVRISYDYEVESLASIGVVPLK